MADFRTAHKGWMLSYSDGYLACCGATMSCAGCEGKCGGAGSGIVYNADYNQAQELVKRAEGGYSNDPRDRGGETYKGVSRVYHPKWSGWVIVDAYKKNHTLKTNDVIRDSKLDALVESFYRTEFWNSIGGDKIKDQKVANIIYDSAVNQGQGAAKNYVKDSLKIAKYDVNAINAADPGKLFNEIGKRRVADYKEKGGYALNSWLKRVQDLGYNLKRNKGKTMAVALGLGLLISGIVVYRQNK